MLVSLVGLLVGGASHVAGHAHLGDAIWIATTSLGAAAALWWIVAGLLEHRIGGDLIALLALCGALAVREQLAGAVIAVMLTSGRALEAFAAGRAHRELRSLLARAPSFARRREGASIETIPVAAVVRGDVLLLGRGDVVPVDGTVQSGRAVLDESALTGEAFPVERTANEAVQSGAVNVGEAFDLVATTTAEDSSYAGIVRLVREADAAGAPLVRLADRYAFGFLLFTLCLASVAWALSGELSRAVAVLVVATPCPLILAVPVALVSGLSALARLGVVVKGGAVLEQLTRCRTLLFDKTGTLTSGRPTVSDVVVTDTSELLEVVRLGASLDQASLHPLALALVRHAHDRGLDLSRPLDVEEELGSGISGVVDARRVSIGKAGFVGLDARNPLAREARRRSELDGSLTVFIAVDDAPAGVFIMRDPIRPDAARVMRSIRRQGIERTVMVTGDRNEVAEVVGAVIGVEDVLAERSPEEKVEAVRIERLRAPVIMVGDGINDAAALALADVGVAMGARGASASSEAADVVLTVDRLDRLCDALFLAKRTVGIARQSIVAGIGLSVIAMGFAAAGVLPAVWGALLQEAIDAAVILNSLRALRTVSPRPRLSERDAEVFRAVREEHVGIRAAISALGRAAASWDASVEPGQLGLHLAREAQRLLDVDVIPHERREEQLLYPVLARTLGGTDRTSTMSRAHVEIAHRIRQLGRLLDYVDEADPSPSEVAELRRLLHGLAAILELHTAQEDESYLSWLDDGAESGDSRHGASSSARATLASPDAGARERA